MLFLKELHIENYKNLKSVNSHFNSRFISFTGDNGAGKTNLLDAIYYLSFGKSHFTSVEFQNISQNEPYFNIRGQFIRQDEEYEIFTGFALHQKKRIRKNGVHYKKFSDHIGEFPVVVVTPYDIDLIIGGSEERRKFMDVILSQIDRLYLDHLVKYHHTLKQRNAILLRMAETGEMNHELIEIYNAQMCGTGNYLYEKRKQFILEFEQTFISFYSVISGEKEPVAMEYVSQLDKTGFESLLKESIRKDIALGRTTNGIHKDELEFSISGFPLKRYGSQGQMKSYLLALKLGQYQTIRENKGFAPILLLDDLFDRLDKNRIRQLVEIISEKNFGQVFITDTSKARIKDVFGKLEGENQIFEMENGNILI